MFEMKKTKIVQLVLLIISCISLIVVYIQYYKLYTIRSADFDKAIIVYYASKIVLFVSIILNIVIQCIRKDVEDNLEALKKRVLDEIKKD